MIVSTVGCIPCCFHWAVVIISDDSIRSVIKLKKIRNWDCLFYYFHDGKSAAETKIIIYAVEDERAVSVATCEFRFNHRLILRTGGFNLNDKSGFEWPQEVSNNELQALLKQNATQSIRQLFA